MTKRELLLRIQRAIRRTENEIRANREGGMFARGLATEGYAGGYRDALYAVDQLIRGVEPNDSRGYWT